MTLAQVLQLINTSVVPNNNNEITANVLRPVLVEMLQQPNDLIGVLSNLNTSANTNLVDAINELKDNIDQLNNISIYQGIGDPNLNPNLNPKVADFYSQIDVNDNIVDLWIYTGIGWVSLNNNNSVTYNPQSPTPTQQQIARDNIDVYSRQEVDDAISTATAPKTKELFSHVLTAADIANPIIDLTLPNTPDLDEWEFLYINSGAVSPESYTVAGNVLSIDTTKISYPVQAGRVVTYRYMY